MMDLLTELRSRGWPSPQKAEQTATDEILVWKSGPMTIRITRSGRQVEAELTNDNYTDESKKPMSLILDQTNIYMASTFLEPWRRHFVTIPSTINVSKERREIVLTTSAYGISILHRYLRRAIKHAERFEDSYEERDALTQLLNSVDRSRYNPIA